MPGHQWPVALHHLQRFQSIRHQLHQVAQAEQLAKIRGFGRCQAKRGFVTQPAGGLPEAPGQEGGQAQVGLAQGGQRKAPAQLQQGHVRSAGFQ
ncbi:hypothetical protein D9M69_701180 [compost metagenome]